MPKKAAKRHSKPILKNEYTLWLVGSVALIAVIILAVVFIQKAQENDSAVQDSTLDKAADMRDFSGLQSELFPKEGFKTKIILGDTIPKLVESGALDLEKFKQLYGSQLKDWQLKLLTTPSNEPLTLTSENANFLLNVFWALGISNKNPILDETAKYEGVANLAATGGWSLGTNADAMVYFNKFELIKLTPAQQANVKEVADNSFRPCCNNPTSFPDCNHGAALLALLELGAAQGLTKDELYTLALQANTLWFSSQYLSTATLYKSEGKDYWSSAKEIMSAKYSSGSGWAQNVYAPLQEQKLLPKAEGGGSCGV